MSAERSGVQTSRLRWQYLLTAHITPSTEDDPRCAPMHFFQYARREEARKIWGRSVTKKLFQANCCYNRHMNTSSRANNGLKQLANKLLRGHSFRATVMRSYEDLLELIPDGEPPSRS